MDETLERQEVSNNIWLRINDMLSALGKSGHVSHDTSEHTSYPTVSGPMHHSDVVLHEEPGSSSGLTTYQHIPASIEDTSILIHTRGDNNLFNIVLVVGGLIGVSTLITSVPIRSRLGRAITNAFKSIHEAPAAIPTDIRRRYSRVEQNSKSALHNSIHR